jgi:osmoprotectant transport system ATP-binding protein
MIRIEALTKQFPGVAQPAVDGLSLDVAAGEICVLIGPSGCGKTTTMRMINRMIEPTSGRIEVAGQDVLHADPVQLRRSIGYVIQQVGLFPHMSVADNVATVPRLLGWDAARIARRSDELLELVGLAPTQFRARFPRQLSGGQKQRVGVARALAGDPPVLLMDEPFGALDPITRVKLQDEFLRILRQLHKTIVLVTHDIDEAIRLGSRIAILRAGRLLQYATPEALLAAPADPFVEEFVGADRALKRLSLLPVADHLVPAADATWARDGLPTLAPEASLREALAALLAAGRDHGCVADARGLQGYITLDSIKAASGVRPEDRQLH